MKEQSSTQQASGSTPEKKYLTVLTDTAWTLATAALWPLIKMSPTEMDYVKRCIQCAILLGSDLYRGYMNFCERVLLARELLLQGNQCKIVINPAQWINGKCLHSYRDTEQLHISFLLTRKQTRLYKLNLSALAEGVLHLNEELTLANYLYWVNFFKSIHAEKELRLFHSCADNLVSDSKISSPDQSNSHD